MSKVIFSFEKIDTTMSCSNDELMKDICQKYANFIGKNIDSLRFSYDEKEINFQLSFEKLVNEKDKEKNEMKIFVYKNEDNQYRCPKCGEKIKFNKIDNITLSMNNLKDSFNGIKLYIDNIIKLSSDNAINSHLKNVNILLNGLNDEINKINEEINHLPINEDKNTNKEIKREKANNYILAEFNIININENIRILNCYFLNPFLKADEKEKNEEEIRNCEIEINGQLIPFSFFHKFQSTGRYVIKYSFKNSITNANSMFAECSSLTKINLSNFNTDNITNMHSMFEGCSSLTCIDLSNFNTNNVIDMDNMFKGCVSLKKQNIITNDQRLLKNIN